MTTSSASSAGGSTSSSSSSSSGGVKCSNDADCASQNTTCMSFTCFDGACMGMPAATGLACTEDGGKLCNSAGFCVACLSSSNCPPTGTSCVSATCSSTGACGTQNEPDHSTCSDSGGKVCLAGACVACITTADCSTGNDCTTKNVCVGQCSDGVQDGNETDVDCGGGSCPPCVTGKKCVQSTDCIAADACETGVCTACVSNYNQPCGSCNGVYDCTGTCTIATPLNYGDACGSCGGKIRVRRRDLLGRYAAEPGRRVHGEGQVPVLGLPLWHGRLQRVRDRRDVLLLRHAPC